ncbi:hypothetical protein CVT25_007176 [Psilocybe cyanescens]|uniref:F-box domain-containing protein n=1 Tax=Psilocybe cyanescens TaxID=93625 RepID=A0A409X707_PSICY|nr:hypothetical protein CVT25_007176 [Psilocybe cyanescens]
MSAPFKRKTRSTSRRESTSISPHSTDTAAPCGRKTRSTSRRELTSIFPHYTGISAPCGRKTRSTRTSTLLGTNATTADSPVACGAAELEDNQPPKKRRKATLGKSSSRTSKKKLVEAEEIPEIQAQGLNGLPTELWLLEIFIYLEPKDLLHLSRTSKRLHSALASEEANTLWKNSRSLIETAVKQYQCAATIDVWEQEYIAAQDKCEWLKVKREELLASGRHEETYLKWAENSLARILYARRKERVVEHIKSLGWEAELASLDRYDYRDLLDGKTVKKACEREMTDRDLNALDPFINQALSAGRQKRLRTERSRLLYARLPVLKKVIKACVSAYPLNTPAPTAAELFFIPLVQDIMTNTSLTPFAEAHLDPMLQGFAEIARRWQSDTEAKLLDLIKVACGSTYTFNPETVLRLATTVFSCNKCSTYGEDGSLWHPRVLAHNHYIQKREGFEQDSATVDCLILQSLTGYGPWNYEDYITFKQKDVRVMSDVLNQFGFDPTSTTATEMDAADPIFECVLCNCPFRGRYVMRWPMVVRSTHCTSQHDAYLPPFCFCRQDITTTIRLNLSSRIPHSSWNYSRTTTPRLSEYSSPRRIETNRPPTVE